MSRYRWLVFGVLAIGYILVYFHRLCTAVVANDMMRDLEASATLAGFLAAAYFYPYALMQIPAGLPSPLQATIYFGAVPGAVGYRIYRTPVANLASGAEELLAALPGTAPSPSSRDTPIETDRGLHVSAPDSKRNDVSGSASAANVGLVNATISTELMAEIRGDLNCMITLLLSDMTGIGLWIVASVTALNDSPMNVI
mgnify:CR=1 FL=1